MSKGGSEGGSEGGSDRGREQGREGAQSCRVAAQRNTVKGSGTTARMSEYTQCCAKQCSLLAQQQSRQRSSRCIPAARTLQPYSAQRRALSSRTAVRSARVAAVLRSRHVLHLHLLSISMRYSRRSGTARGSRSRCGIREEQKRSAQHTRAGTHARAHQHTRTHRYNCACAHARNHARTRPPTYPHARTHPSITRPRTRTRARTQVVVQWCRMCRSRCNGAARVATEQRDPLIGQCSGSRCSAQRMRCSIEAHESLAAAAEQLGACYAARGAVVLSRSS